MTKEELKRKQYDTWNKYYQKHRSEINARRKKVREENKNKLSVAEKRIEELIALINAERERQEKCDDVHLRKIADLEKENAELKEQIKQIEKVSDYNADQLAQAKEIIKDLMSFPVQLCDCRHTVDFEKTREKAVQFLKEIEK